MQLYIMSIEAEEQHNGQRHWIRHMSILIVRNIDGVGKIEEADECVEDLLIGFGGM